MFYPISAFQRIDLNPAHAEKQTDFLVLKAVEEGGWWLHMRNDCPVNILIKQLSE